MVGDADPLRFCGSTAVMVAVVDLCPRGVRLVCSNVGDSRAILVRQRRRRLGEGEDVRGVVEALPLSDDHSPGTRPDEVSRIVKLGGKVSSSPYEQALIYASGGNVESCRRVYQASGIGGLNMTRSLGDEYLKPLVIPTPETTVTRLDLVRTDAAGDDECPSFLVLASDGIWDVLSNEEVAESVWNIAERFSKDGRNSLNYRSLVQTCALELVQKAQKYGIKDNITCMVVQLPSNKL